MTIIHEKLGSRGRLQIPASIRQAMNLRDGDAVDMEVVGGMLRITPIKAASPGGHENTLEIRGGD